MVERILRADPLPTGGGRIIATPFQFALTGNENLRIVSANSKVGCSLLVQGRVLQSDGTIAPFSATHVPNSDRTRVTQDVPMAAVALMNFTVVAVGASPQRGQTFVQLQVILGFGGATTVLGTLLQGYVTSVQHLAWPGSPIDNSLDGQGFTRVIHGTQPAPGAGISESCPTNARWRLQTVKAHFGPSAVAADRVPALGVTRSGHDVMNVPAGGLVVAGMSVDITWLSPPSSTVLTTGGTTLMTGPIPTTCYLSGGDNFGVTALGIAAGDQWSAPDYQVEEWLEMN